MIIMDSDLKRKIRADKIVIILFYTFELIYKIIF